MRNGGNVKRRRRNVCNWNIVLLTVLYGSPPAAQFYTDPLNDAYTDPAGIGYTD